VSKLDREEVFAFLFLILHFSVAATFRRPLHDSVRRRGKREREREREREKKGEEEGVGEGGPGQLSSRPPNYPLITSPDTLTLIHLFVFPSAPSSPSPCSSFLSLSLSLSLSPSPPLPPSRRRPFAVAGLRPLGYRHPLWIKIAPPNYKSRSRSSSLARPLPSPPPRCPLAPARSVPHVLPDTFFRIGRSSGTMGGLLRGRRYTAAYNYCASLYKEEIGRDSTLILPI